MLGYVHPQPLLSIKQIANKLYHTLVQRYPQSKAICEVMGTIQKNLRDMVDLVPKTGDYHELDQTLSTYNSIVFSSFYG